MRVFEGTFRIDAAKEGGGVAGHAACVFEGF